jgi:putative salt-induced outer membrane protein YdiY
MRPAVMTRSTRVPCLLVALLAIGGSAAAQQTLSLSSGDRLTGRLVRITDSTWVFHYAGSDLKLAVSTVAGLTASEPIGLRLSDSTIGAATISPAQGELTLTFADGTVRTVAPAALAAVGAPDHLDALRPTHIGLFSPITRFWGATGSLGLSDKSGNSTARGIAFSLDVGRTTPRDRISAGFAVHRESSQPPGGTYQATVEKYFGYLRADIYVSGRLFTFAQTQQERDKFQDLRLRSTYTAGLGVQAVSTTATDLRFSASSGLRHQAFYTAANDQTAVAVAGYSLAQRLGPATFAWRFEATPSLEDFNDYQFRSDASISTALVAGLGLRLGAVNEFNNQPQPGIKKHDMLLTTTVTYSVGR